MVERQKSDTPVHTPRYKRLTDDQRVAILKLAKLGKLQTEIAQAVGCDQGSVSRWLSQCADTTEHASTYLRGSALRMAQNIVNRGLARDHIQALNGLGVLNQPVTGGVQVTINGLSLSGLGRGETVEAEEVQTFASEDQALSTGKHLLSDDTGSDN